MAINIALDGPSGAGKSTLAKRLAKELGYIYVDTGALYRTVGLYVLRNNIDTKDVETIKSVLPKIKVHFDFVDDVQHVYLNDEDVTGLIRTQEVSMAASVTSAIPAVRAFLLDLQRDIAKNNNIIMDGRDIGTVILPNAQVKFFVTVTVEERARRRFKELKEKGLEQEGAYERILNEIKERDLNDSTRASAPLKKADDAIDLDNSGDFEETVKFALNKIQERI